VNANTGAPPFPQKQGLRRNEGGRKLYLPQLYGGLATGILGSLYTLRQWMMRA
jgi:hypothetical protein